MASSSTDIYKKPTIAKIKKQVENRFVQLVEGITVFLGSWFLSTQLSLIFFLGGGVHLLGNSVQVNNRHTLSKSFKDNYFYDNDRLVLDDDDQAEYDDRLLYDYLH